MDEFAAAGRAEDESALFLRDDEVVLREREEAEGRGGGVRFGRREEGRGTREEDIDADERRAMFRPDELGGEGGWFRAMLGESAFLELGEGEFADEGFVFRGCWEGERAAESGGEADGGSRAVRGGVIHVADP
jgi:hypothetical protein